MITVYTSDYIVVKIPGPLDQLENRASPGEIIGAGGMEILRRKDD